MRRFVIYWLPVIACMAVIFVASAQPQLPEIGEPGSPWDPIAHKVAHVVIYGVLALLLYRMLGQLRVAAAERGSLAFLLAVLYGLSDELHQMFVPGRSGQLADVALDALGAAAAILVWMWLERRVRPALQASAQ